MPNDGRSDGVRGPLGRPTSVLAGALRGDRASAAANRTDEAGIPRGATASGSREFAAERPTSSSPARAVRRDTCASRSGAKARRVVPVRAGRYDRRISAGRGDGELSTWGRIREELFDRQFATLRRVVGSATGLALDDLDKLFALEQPADCSWPTAAEARERAAPVLREPLRAADAPQRELLAMYVYIRCLALWEKTSDHDRIRAIGNGLSDVLGEPGPTDAVLAALVDEFAWLD